MTHPGMFFERVPQRHPPVDFVVVPTPDSLPIKSTFRYQIGDDAMRRTFRDPDAFGDLPQGEVRIARQTHEYMGMVGEEGPSALHRSQATTSQTQIARIFFLDIKLMT